MARPRIVARPLVFSALGVFLAGLVGCGGQANNPSLTPDAPGKQQEARQAAYGKAGTAGGKAPKGGQAARPPGK